MSRAAIISDRRITGLSADVIAERVAELGPLWHERHVITSYSIHYTKVDEGSRACRPT
ncbi:hypothetical protein [Streptomyces cyaneogriseus]|uniref:hypothetical protein n=1 Tax=Streptomyces cyaneogriseus TaxID=68192 RepID=UPI001EF105E7|nr:hypothetical protein [Streptomyces cyaneogriseus]